MTRKKVRMWSMAAMQETRSVIWVTVCFAVGAVAGLAMSAKLEGEGAQALEQYLAQYLSAVQVGGAQRWTAFFGATMKAPLLVTVLRFTALGVLLIPLVMGARGFLLSFAVSAFVRCYGGKGYGAALLLFGVPCGAELLLLFVLACNGWVGSMKIGCESSKKERLATLRIYVVCYLVLLSVVLLQVLSAKWLSNLLAKILVAE